MEHRNHTKFLIFPVYWEKYEVSIDIFMGICTWWFSYSGQGESQSCSFGTKNQAIFFSWLYLDETEVEAEDDWQEVGGTEADIK